MQQFRGPTGTYTCINIIGRGTYGRVYQCRKQGSSDEFAVKELKMSKLELMEMLPNYVREVTIMKTLRHPHLVSFIEEFEFNNKVYLVTEYCEDGDLVKYMRGRQFLEQKEVLRITAEILEGLCFMHTQGYMHRDLKPDNIFLKEGGVVKIGDYGMSKKAETGLKNTNNVGTPMYSSPELLHGQGNYTASTDLFSAGLIIYYVLFKSHMFREATSIDHLKQLQFKYLRPHNLQKFISQMDCSDIFKELLTKVLVFDQNERSTILQVVEWFARRSGIAMQCNLRRMVSKSEEELLRDVQEYFRKLKDRVSGLEQRYLKLANSINDPNKYRLSNLDRYVQIYLLMGIYILETRTLLETYKDNYYRSGDRLINWKTPEAEKFTAYRDSLLNKYSQYYDHCIESFTRLNETVREATILADGHWYDRIESLTVIYMNSKKLETVKQYKEDLLDYLNRKRIHPVDIDLERALKEIVK